MKNHIYVILSKIHKNLLPKHVNPLHNQFNNNNNNNNNKNNNNNNNKYNNKHNNRTSISRKHFKD